MLNFSLLSEEQIYGDNKLNYFNNNSSLFPITDFAILSGVVPHQKDNRVVGKAWIYSDYLENVKSTDKNAAKFTPFTSRSIGLLPSIDYAEFGDVELNTDEYGNLVFMYGVYPQTVCDENLSDQLENQINVTLHPTSKPYTTDVYSYRDEDMSFTPRENPEYVYEVDGSKYVRIVATEASEGEYLSDGRRVRLGKAYWVKVEPIKWVVLDQETRTTVPSTIIAGGIQYNSERLDYNYKGFEESNIRAYLDNYFSNEILVNYSRISSEDENRSR